MIKNRLGQRVPHCGIDRLEARKLRDGVAQLGAELIVRFRAARKADNGERLRKLAFVGEVIERRDELAVGEVAGSPEDDQRTRFRCLPGADAFAKWIGSECALHSHGPTQNYHTYDAGRKRAVSGHDWFGKRKGFQCGKSWLETDGRRGGRRARGSDARQAPSNP